MTSYHSEEEWLNWVDELSENNYVVIDQFLKPELYGTVRSFFLDKLSEFHQAGIGALDQNMVLRNIRGDETYWLDEKVHTELHEFWSLIQETIYVLNRYCFLSISGSEFHFAHYPPGGHYEQHLDQFEGRNNRMISVVIYLNEGWKEGDGGELRLEDASGRSIDVQPHRMKAVLFKSAEVPHEVLMAHKSRYSLTGWLLHQPAGLGALLG